MMSKQPEIRSLTGLRGSAAIFVVIYHLFGGIAYNPINNSPAIVFLSHGYIAVDLFFVLSGYVMALTYAKMFAFGFRIQAFSDFLGRRIGRVYPAYIFVTILVAAFDLSMKHWQGAGSELVLLTNALMIQSWGFSDSIIGPAWSVSTELSAYLLFPLLVGVVLQSRRKWAWIGAAIATAVLLLVAMQSSAALHQGPEFASRHGPLDVYGAGTAFPILRCLGGFTLGLIGFRLAQHPYVRQQAHRMFAGDFAMALIVMLMFIRNTDILLVVLFVPLVVTLAEQRSLSSTLLSSPILHWFGLISYSLYLVHQPLGSQLHIPLMMLLNGLKVPHAYTASEGLMLIPIVIAATMSYYWIEKPGRRWSRRLFKTGLQSSVPSVRIATGARRAK